MDKNNNPAIKVTICTPTNVQKLFTDNLSYSKAWRMIQTMRDALNKPQNQIYTIEDFKTYYGI